MNKQNTRKIFLFLGIILAFLSKASFVLALEINYPNFTVFGQHFHLDSTSTLQEYACYFFGLGQDLAFFITVLIIAFGGVYYLVSYGQGKFTNEGKEWIKAGFLGLLIVISASLISYTINPNLTICKLGILSMLNLNPSNVPGLPPGVRATTYTEIPIGTLTENLLTRKINCYGFDQNGDPIDGDDIKTDDGTTVAGPTYMDHDRADCLAALIDGAQKKAQAVRALSNELTNLMNTCSCRIKDPVTGADTGTSKCEKDGTFDGVVGCPGGQCTGTAVKGSGQNSCSQAKGCDNAGQCVKGGSGRSCSNSADCQPLGCDSSNKCIAGGSGGACTSDADCQPKKGCDNTSHCVVGGTGDVCTSDTNCQPLGCNNKHQCIHGGTGTACTKDTDCQCNTPMNCGSNKKCIAGGSGGSCTSDADCKPLGCNDKYQCVPGGSGGACFLNSDCTSPLAQPVNPPDCCPQRAGLIDPTTGSPFMNPTTGKELSVKDQIEHGPIDITVGCGDWAPSAPGSSSVTFDRGGCVRNIHWTSSNFNSKVEIWLCAQSDASSGEPLAQAAQDYCHIQLASDVDNTGSATITLPSSISPSTYYFYVRKSGDTNNRWEHDAFSGALSIGMAAVTYDPAGDWIKGATKNVKWTASSFDSSVEIWLCTQSDASANTTVADAAKNYCHIQLVNDASNNGNYSVNFPKMVSPGIYYFYVKKSGDSANTYYGNGFSDRVTVGRYNGLDEFRCPNVHDDPNKPTPCDGPGVVAFVEKSVTVKGQAITIIDQDNWGKLNLLQQMMYFKEKIDNNDAVKTIKQDKQVLDDARAKLASDQCYFAMPYVDILKTYEITDQQKHIILKDPETFIDPVSSKPIDVSKYCQGFNYANSSCLKKCDDMCPDTSQDAINLFKLCTNPFDQQECIKDAYNVRPCSYGFPKIACDSNIDCPFGETCDANNHICQDDSTDKNFGSCMASCQQDCSNNCAKQYSPCSDSDQYKSCVDQCKNNGQCPLDNADKCLFGAQNFAGCSNQVTDQGDTNYCIKNAYTCKNGSDNYAGDRYCTKIKCPSPSNCPDCACPAGPQCNQYSYNDDPLTFYCEDSWQLDPDKENNSKALGNEKIVPVAVPVGQTVDDAESWADALLKSADDINKNDTQAAIDQMRTAGLAINGQTITGEATPIQDYCKCNAKFDNGPHAGFGNFPGGPICQTDYTYHADPLPAGGYNCYCTFVPCQGNPCQQVTDYLGKLSGDCDGLKAGSMNFSQTESTSRSNIMQELSYSRTTADKCSLIGETHGLLETRLLSCTRVEKEQIDPIITGRFNEKGVIGYCHGVKLGYLYAESATDDWFCAEEYSKTPTFSNNPIYNTTQ